MLNNDELKQVYDYILTHGRTIESLGKLPQNFSMDEIDAFPAVHNGTTTLLVPMTLAKTWMTEQANDAAKAAAAAVAAEEAAARQDADNALSEGINAESTERANKDEELRNLVNVEVTARIGADTELLNRIKGTSDASNAYTDPFRYIGNFTPSYDATGNLEYNAIQGFQTTLLNLLRNENYRNSFPYIGKMKALIEGVPIEAWNFVKTWNQGSTSGVFVQVVRTNYALSAGVISSAATSEFHEYFRTVTVSMVDGSVTDVTATEWKESTLRDTDRQNIASIAFLGDFNNINEAAAQAATVQYAGNADYVLLRFRIGGKGGLILQNVNGNSTEQYLFNDGKRYVRYVDFTSADRTSVKKVQAWKLDGVAYIFYDSAKRIIYQRNQWDENISGGGPSTLPLASASYAGMLSTTMFNHLSNFNIYEHSVPTTTSVRLVFTNPITGTATNVTLAAVTSARAGVMTAELYNELKQATAGVAAEESARISLGNQIAADIQSIRDALATVQTNESNHYTEMQTHLSSIYKRLAAAETKLSDLEKRVQTIEAHLNLRTDGDFEEL